MDAHEVDRTASIEQVRADPPRIHEASASGIWSTTASCYQFLAAHVPTGGRTSETGIGVSPVLLTLRGARHTCVCHSPTRRPVSWATWTRAASHATT